MNVERKRSVSLGGRPASADPHPGALPPPVNVVGAHAPADRPAIIAFKFEESAASARLKALRVFRGLCSTITVTFVVEYLLEQRLALGAHLSIPLAGYSSRELGESSCSIITCCRSNNVKCKFLQVVRGGAQLARWSALPSARYSHDFDLTSSFNNTLRFTSSTQPSGHVFATFCRGKVAVFDNFLQILITFDGKLAGAFLIR